MLLLSSLDWTALSPSVYECTSCHNCIWRRPYDTANFAVQVIFSLVFALSVNLLQLVLFEILGVLDYRCARPSQRQGTTALPVLLQACALNVSADTRNTAVQGELSTCLTRSVTKQS